MYAIKVTDKKSFNLDNAGHWVWVGNGEDAKFHIYLLDGGVIVVDGPTARRLSDYLDSLAIFDASKAPDKPADAPDARNKNIAPRSAFVSERLVNY